MGTDAATKTAAHTPGPWRLDEKHNKIVDATYHVIEAGDPYAGEMGEKGFHLSGIMSLADARLITAAPELLAALKALSFEFAVLRWGQPYPGRPHAALDAAEAAIAAAEGSAP